MALDIKPEPNGDIYSLYPYIFYDGGGEIQLDGHFSIDDLRKLARHMELMVESDKETENELRQAARPQ